MSLSKSKGTRLKTYSKKPTNLDKSTIRARRPTPAQQRSLVTLTSPSYDLLSSPGLIPIPPSSSDDHFDNYIHNNIKVTSRHLPIGELTFSASPPRSLERDSSPLSSSEHDPISDDHSIIGVSTATESPRKGKTPRSLSTWRKALKLRPTRPRLMGTSPKANVSIEIRQAIERGSDGFVDQELRAVPKLKRAKRCGPHQSAVGSTLEIREGPHPPVDFQGAHWMIVQGTTSSYKRQNDERDLAEHDDKRDLGEYDDAKSLEAEQYNADTDTSLTRVALANEGSPQSHTWHSKMSGREALVHAQLSPVSAPVSHQLSDESDEEKEGEEDQSYYGYDDDLTIELDDCENDSNYTSEQVPSVVKTLEQQDNASTAPRIVQRGHAPAVPDKSSRAEWGHGGISIGASPSRSWITESVLSAAP